MGDARSDSGEDAPISASERAETVRLIHAWQAGDGVAGEALFSRVAEELRAIADSLLRGERRDHTLQPTALVSELYLKLVGLTELEYTSRNHFLSMAARAMRQILVDHARGRNAAKRGPEWVRTDLQPLAREGADPIDVLVLEEALEALERIDARRVRFIELRYYAGLSLVESAAALEIPLSTAKRHWRSTRAWLADFFEARPPGAPA